MVVSMPCSCESYQSWIQSVQGREGGDLVREIDFDECQHRERDDMGKGLSNMSCSGWCLFVSMIGLCREVRWLLQ